MTYEVCKYCGRAYCGNAFFNTIDECIKFANDGFCNKAIITGNGVKYIVKIEA